MRLPFVSVGIIPADAQRAAIATIGFWIFDDAAVALETPTAAIKVTRPQEIGRYVALFEQLLSDAHRQQVHALSQLVAVEGDDSPLGRLRTEVVADLKDHVGEVRRDVAALAERIAVHEAVAPVLEQTSVKGFRFEDVVDARVSALADLSAHPQLRRTTFGSSAGPIELPALAATIDNTVQPLGRVPELGEHTETVRAEFAAP